MTTYALDFEQIKRDHLIEAVADRLGLELKKAGHQLRGPCFSGAEGNRKLVITPAKGLWYSFALNRGGDVISLVAEVQQVDAKTAARWIVGDPEPEKKPRTERTSSPERSERGFAPLDYLEHDHPAVDALGFDADTASTLGIGWAPRGMMKNTVAVPLRTEDGTLVAYMGIQDPVKLPPSFKF